jgi:hypothetical protein
VAKLDAAITMKMAQKQVLDQITMVDARHSRVSTRIIGMVKRCLSRNILYRC